MISPPGTKRVVLALTDVIWTTIHHNPQNHTNLDKIEDMVIAKDYSEYNKFRRLAERKTMMNQIISFMKKQLKINIL